MRLLPAWLVLCLLLAAPIAAGEVDFERDVAPLLVRHCIGCHNESEPAGELDLSTSAKLLAGGESGAPAVTPGDVEASYLIERVQAGEMPPEGKGQPVPAADVKKLEAWIAAGASWPEGRVLSAFDLTTDLRAGRDWWSLAPPHRPAVPKVEHAEQVRTPIDAFVIARLEQAGLAPAREADRATFIRRASLDLLGLPPTRDEIEAFVADTSLDAYEKLIDRLLASPHYGERWGRHWLDVVRFGESDGYEKNLPRENAWPYRDWVIAALNNDLPYPQFILAQLAGDQIGVDAATGFLVGGAHDSVSSPDVELTLNQRANDLDDMLKTTTTAFLGLTAGCAKCHDHKFDPIAQRDYYELQAMFAGVQHGERELRTADYEVRKQQRAELEQEIERLEREVDDLTSRHQPLASLDSAAEPQRPPVHPRLNVDRFAPVSARFVRFTVLATSNIEPCVDELEIFTAGDDARNVALASAVARATASSVYGNGSNKIHQLDHVNDGRFGNGRSWISAETGGGWVQIELAEPAEIERVVWARDREGRFEDRLATRYRIDVSDDGDDWRPVATGDDRAPYDAEKKPLEPPRTAGLAAEVAEQVSELQQRIAAQRKKLKDLAPTMAYLGTFKQSEATRLCYRGDPMQQRDEVAPGGIDAVGKLELPADAPEAERRRALAGWIGRPDNPLTARVMVNRIWHYHFGQGLVNTPSDFGFNGGRPSHAELLDYLACYFVEGGWRPKAVHRLIMLSHVYRQASDFDAKAAKQDADARLLWRFPPRRLEAEAIRDSILFATGVLDERMGGPGYSVFKPNTNYVRVYEAKQEFGPAEWRRMIYQDKPRSRQDGTFGEFDCPDASQVVGKRNVSTTALQALNLLNASFMIEQSELLARRLEREATRSRRTSPPRLLAHHGPRPRRRRAHRCPRAHRFARPDHLLPCAVQRQRVFVFELRVAMPRRDLQQPILSHAGRRLLDRRGFLTHAAGGLSGIALANLLAGEGLLAASDNSPLRPDIRPDAPLAARRSHFPAKAKRVLMIFCSGACSHLDTWDYKPELIKRHDTPMPGEAKLVTFQGKNGNLIKSPWEFRPRGESGKYISDLLPNLAELADEMCFIHSMTSKTNTHGPGENFMSTGFTVEGYPSAGAWVSYALGSECDNLPAFVAIPDPRGIPQVGPNNWSSGFLPAVFQGTSFNAEKPIANLARPSKISADADIATRDFLKLLNDKHLERNPGDSELSARIASYELAAKLQLSAPEAADLARETAATHTAYGTDSPDKVKAGFARTVSWPGGYWSAACASCSSLTAPMRWARAWGTGTVTRRSKISTPSTRRFSISRPPRCSKISRPAGCSTIRWSCGPPSSAACRRFKKAPRGATTIPRASPSGWPAPASSAPPATVRPTSSATRPPRIPAASTSCTPRSCTCWGSITTGSATFTTAPSSGSRSYMAASSTTCSPELVSARSPSQCARTHLV